LTLLFECFLLRIPRLQSHDCWLSTSALSRGAYYYYSNTLLAFLCQHYAAYATGVPKLLLSALQCRASRSIHCEDPTSRLPPLPNMPTVSTRTTTTTATSAHRSTGGCWTCRLRRKKCDEIGMPCQTCSSRELYCHGYGPRPDWKDRGEKERQQAQKLKLRRASAAARDLPLSKSHEDPTLSSPQLPLPPPTTLPPHRAQAAPPRDSTKAVQTSNSCETFSSLLCSPSINLHTFDIGQDLFTTFISDFSYSEHDIPEQDIRLGSSVSDVTRASLSQISSTDTNASIECFSFPRNSVECPTRDEYPREVEDHRFPRLPNSVILQTNDSSAEREAGLMIYYLNKGFKIQFRHYTTHRSEVKSGWLLLFLMRSTPFYYASLSLAAFYLYSSLPTTDSESHIFQDFQKHRVRATMEMRGLSETQYSAMAPSGFLRATEIQACAMQLTFLEVRKIFPGFSSKNTNCIFCSY